MIDDPRQLTQLLHRQDRHTAELPGFLEDHLETTYRGRIGDDVLFPRREGFHSHLKEAHNGAAFDESQIMLAKNWAALGSSARHDRPRRPHPAPVADRHPRPVDPPRTRLDAAPARPLAVALALPVRTRRPALHRLPDLTTATRRCATGPRGRPQRAHRSPSGAGTS
jgi:hypothetical protein